MRRPRTASLRIESDEPMKRLLVTSIVVTLSATPAVSGPLSGKVEILEKGGTKRPAVSGVLVYLEGAKGEIPAAMRSKVAIISSHNKSFEPHVEAVPVGATMSFPNLDNIMHNVFSLSKGNRFDLGLYKDGAKKDFVFKKPGLVRIYCNIHPQMSAFVYVMDHPYFAWASRDGSFRIDDVPPGNYTLAAWSEEGEARQPVTVTESGASGVSLSLDVSKYARRPHLNKYGKPYKRAKY
jgi:plastocyanin